MDGNTFFTRGTLVFKSFLKLLLGRGMGSQFGEDKIIIPILPEYGTYVDIGAYHPHLYSNTYALYRKGWHGTAIDPNPAMKWLWRIFRRRDRFVNAAVGKRGSAKYFMHEDAAYNGFVEVGSSPLIATKTIAVRPLSDFITAQIDFLRAHQITHLSIN